MAIGDVYIKSGMKHVLVIGAEVMSAIHGWTDRNTCVLLVMERDGRFWTEVDESKVLSTHLHANGKDIRFNLCKARRRLTGPCFR